MIDKWNAILATTLFQTTFAFTVNKNTHGQLRHRWRQPFPLTEKCKHSSNFDPSVYRNSLQAADASEYCSKDDSEDIGIYVYDGAFSPSVCEELHYLAIDHNIRGDDGSSIFVRPPHNEKPLTPLENAIDSALTAMGDMSKTVEYWSRDEFMNIDVHADIDEVQLEQEGELRCPKIGHVLYLEVQDGLRGPTCVFPGKKVGWGLDDNNGKEEEYVELVTVPAVQGRILRFPGSAMHGVPRPADRWLLSDNDERAVRKEEKEEIMDEFNDSDDGDNDDSDSEGWIDDDMEACEDEDDDIERSVLLFNTWHDDELPPRGVNGDYATGALPDGIMLDEEGTENNADEVVTDFSLEQDAQRLAEWEKDYGEDAEAIRCNPRSDWKSLTLNQINYDGELDEDTEVEEVRINLMGKQCRRVYPRKNARLYDPTLRLLEALEEETKVSHFRLLN